MGIKSTKGGGQPTKPALHQKAEPQASKPPVKSQAIPHQNSSFSKESPASKPPPGSHSLAQSTKALAPPGPGVNPGINQARLAAKNTSSPRDLPSRQTISDAQALYKAMKGLGTDEAAVYHVLENRSPQERNDIEAEFNHRYANQFDTLQGALKGDFSGSELQRALDGLQSGRAGAPPIGSKAFEARLDQTTGSKRRLGNTSRVLFDGNQSFAARTNLIRNAEQSIYLQTFIFNDDETGWDLAKELSLRAQEGIDVRVIYDGVGSIRADAEMFDYMKDNGVKVLEYGDPLAQFWDLNDRWHEKHLIVDQQVSIEGGMNIANEYALGGSGRLVLSRSEHAEDPWRDVDVQLEGPVVADTVEAFRRNWESLSGDTIPLHQKNTNEPKPLNGTTPIRFVQHRPDEDGDQNTRNVHLEAIRSATQSITIENAYFLPPDKLRHALINAAHRGVQVRIMTNSHESNDIGFVSDASRYFYDELIEAGAQIFEKHGGTLHSKTMTVDGSYSIIGSVNLNGRSQWRDSESMAAIQSEDTAKQLEERFQSGISECKQISQKELESESFVENLKQWAISFLAPTF